MLFASNKPNMRNKQTNIVIKIRVTLSLFTAVVAFSCVFISGASASTIASSDVITLANSARAKDGLPLLTENDKLAAAAQNKASDMLKNDYFAHTSPDGVTPWHWVEKAGYQYKAAGENLAINFDTAKEQHSAWMKSATHRANILNAQYREIGVAVVRGKIDGQESMVTVEFFGTPMYAVADQVTAIPPVVQKAPAEIKGTETIMEENNVPLVPEVVPVMPVEDVSVRDIALQNISEVLPVAETHWLDIATLVFAGLLTLVALATPVVFLGVAYQSLIAVLRDKKVEIAETIESHPSDILEYPLKV